MRHICLASACGCSGGRELSICAIIRRPGIPAFCDVSIMLVTVKLTAQNSGSKSVEMSIFTKNMNRLTGGAALNTY